VAWPPGSDDVTIIIGALLDLNWKVDLIIRYLIGDDGEEEEESDSA
jgi:hypothetical protein